MVICAYSEARFDCLRAAVAATAEQSCAPVEVIVCIDHNPALLERACEALPGARVIPNEGRSGLSGARNTGFQHASGDVVAFLDDDARPEPTWLEELTAAFIDPAVVGAGGVALPAWEGQRPQWLPPELYWVIGCSYKGLPEQVAEVRNPIGANMSFRRKALAASGGFVDGIGRVGAVPLGCEETELSIRVRRATEGVVLHVPSARVHHHVASSRLTWRYLLARCWAEGRSKALVAAHAGADAATSSERRYALRTLPRGVLAGVVAALRGDATGLLRAAAIVAALATTTAGYVRGRLA